MLKRSIISVKELFDNLLVIGDSTKIVICDEVHREIVRGFWFDDRILNYVDFVVEEFAYHAELDRLYVYLLKFIKSDSKDDGSAY